MQIVCYIETRLTGSGYEDTVHVHNRMYHAGIYNFLKLGRRETDENTALRQTTNKQAEKGVLGPAVVWMRMAPQSHRFEYLVPSALGESGLRGRENCGFGKWHC